MVSSAGLVRMAAETTAPQPTVQPTATISEGQRSFHVVLGDNRTVQVVGPNIPANSQILQHSTQGQILRQTQTVSQIPAPSITNMVTSLQGAQVIHEIAPQPQVIRPVLASSQPVFPSSQPVFPAPTPVLMTSQSGIAATSQQQVFTSPQPVLSNQQIQGSETQSPLVTAIVKQHLHLVDPRPMITQGRLLYCTIQVSHGPLKFL